METSNLGNIPSAKQLKAQLDVLKEGAMRVKPAIQKRPDGWWDLSDLTGSAAAVCAEIDKRALPAEWKAAIKAEVTRQCTGDFNAVYVDAHFTVDNGNATLHLTIQPTKMLV